MAPATLFPGVAIVTGAGGRGIGPAVAYAFAEEGCKRVAITDCQAELLSQTRERIASAFPDVQVFDRCGDVTDPAFMKSFIGAIVQRFGRVDYAVNCAGIFGGEGRSSEIGLEAFDAVNNVNYRGCWLSSRAELSAMLKQEPLPSHDPSRPPQRGSIVHIASQLGLVGRPDAPVYCASKAAIIGFTRADAIDYSKDNIRINCVCPGVIATAMTTGNADLEARVAPTLHVAPLGRLGFPKEVADAVLFLCSTKASFIQGHSLLVDGGYVIN